MAGIGVTLFVEKVVLAYYVELFGQSSIMRYVHSHSHASGSHDDAQIDDSNSKLKANASGRRMLMV
jgi:hypothetical protein